MRKAVDMDLMRQNLRENEGTPQEPPEQDLRNQRMLQVIIHHTGAGEIIRRSSERLGKMEILFDNLKQDMHHGHREVSSSQRPSVKCRCLKL